MSRMENDAHVRAVIEAVRDDVENSRPVPPLFVKVLLTEMDELRDERDSLADALRDTAERAQDVEDEAFLMWCSADDAGAW